MAMLLAVILCSWSCAALNLQVEANPIRKVVTLLQDMQHELEAEGEKEKGLFDKFMCYCDGNTDGMQASAKEAAQRITELKSQLEAQKAEKSQLDQELIQHKQDRASSKSDLATATQIRAKEHEEFSEEAGESKANLDAMTGAIAALEKGMGSFMQMSKASISRVRSLVQSSSDVDSEDQRAAVLALLEGKQNPFGDYSARSGEIVGMLKAMKDQMDKDLGGLVSAEDAAQASFEETAAAKKDSIAAAGAAVESKTSRAGELAVAIVNTQDDLEDTTADLGDTQGFLANLASSCATKKKEWAERSATRAQEVAAVSEAIKILNDDDALDLFKKTMSLAQAPQMGFLQKASGSSAVRRARNLVAAIRSDDKGQLALLQYALTAKKVDFSKVLGMIDNMVVVLGKEQKDDDSQHSFCEKDFEKSAARKSDTESAIEASKASVADMEESSNALAQEVATLSSEIKALDKAVAEATSQRQGEHADFLTYQSEANAAVQLIEKAKNRLFEFYRPNLHKEEAAAEASLVAVSMRGAPPPPPETWGAYQKKDGKSNGVIALMEMLVKEVQDEITEATHDEETSQADYERLMSESQTSRAKKADGITTKEAAKADLDEKTENTKAAQSSQEAELMNVNGYIAQLHASCDFLVANYDLRKAARTNEIESLKNAKAVLSGADFA